MFLAKLSVKRPILVAMFLLVFVIFGGLAYFGLPVNLMPEVDTPYVTIQTIYPGAGPIEVEQQITILIEDAVSTITGIKYIESYSMDNVSIIEMAFNMSVDINAVTQRVRDKIDGIVNNLPDDAMKPVVEMYDLGALPVVQMVLSGSQNSIELHRYASTTLKDRFSQINGVAQVDIRGGAEREFRVILDPNVALANMVSMPLISEIIQINNLNLPAGTFSISNRVLAVRVVGEIADIETLRNLEIPTLFGNKRLSDIAQVIDTSTDVVERITFFDAQTGNRQDDVIKIDLISSGEGNPVQISKELNKQMPSITANLPIDMELAIVNDSSVFVESSISDTMGNIFIGIFLTGLLMFLFLGDIRCTIIIALAMPISIISTFYLMQIAGFSLNMLSLLGLATSVGALVISSIVVIENIFRYKEMGYDRADSAIKGTSEIAVAVLASALTNLVVFLPIGTMSGYVGSIFTEFGLTVVFATVFSLIVSFTLTPMLAALILPEKIPVTKVSEMVDKFTNALKRVYLRSLNFCLKTKKHSYWVLVLTLLLFLFSLTLFPKIGFEFMPILDEGDIGLKIELPIGYNLDETESVVKQIESVIAQYPETLHIMTTLGRTSEIDIGMHLANSSVKLVDVKEREHSIVEIANRMTKDLAHIPNARIQIAPKPIEELDMGSPIFMILTGMDNDKLNEILDEIVDKFKTVPGLVNLDTSRRTGRPELIIEPKREQLALTGTSVLDVAIGTRAAVEGLIAAQFRENDKEYDIRVTMEEVAYNSPERLRSLSITTEQGTFQLSSLVDVKFTEGVNRIIRRDKAKAILITGDTATGFPLSDVTREIEKRLADIDFPDGYKVVWSGDAEMMNESVVDMTKAFILAIILLFILLAATLEGFKQPLLIMSTVPLSLIGVLFVQYLTGLTMNIMSMMAIIMLIGIVVNDAILILDFTNLFIKQEGKTMKEALIMACDLKLESVIITSISVILAMLPMSLGMGDAGKEFRQSMGIVSIGGMLIAMILTLYVIPALGYVTEKTSTTTK